MKQAADLSVACFNMWLLLAKHMEKNYNNYGVLPRETILFKGETK